MFINTSSRISSLWDTGQLSTHEIARVVGLSEAVVYNCISGHDGALHKPQMRFERATKFYDDLANGKSLEQIAKDNKTTIAMVARMIGAVADHNAGVAA